MSPAASSVLLLSPLVLAFAPPLTRAHRYTPLAEVQRARQAFEEGRKSILVVTERFYFFKRWRLPGAHSFLFYSPPQHELFYSELINSVPGVHSNLSMCLFTDLDTHELERVVGSERAQHMVTSSKSTFLLQ